MKRYVSQYLILGCCVAGAILSAFSLQSHYSTSATEYCDLSATFNCDLVNRSAFSQIRGMPVALVGLLGYIVLLALSVRSTVWTMALRFAAAVIGLSFALYLAYIEAYVLAVWCLLCIGSLGAILAITVLSGIAIWQDRKLETAIDAGK